MEADVEVLLTPEARAGLPLPVQFLLYLHPFALFKDASRGPAREQERALSYNRAQRWMLLPYIRRWALIAASSFIALSPSQALAAHGAMFVVPAAALAVACCIAITVAVCAGTAYVLLALARH
ncbi:MAG TPA: hypothetical protein VI321_02240 [Burkholderiales bacterium]